MNLIEQLESMRQDLAARGFKASEVRMGREFYDALRTELRPMLVYPSDLKEGLGTIFGLPIKIDHNMTREADMRPIVDADGRVAWEVRE